MEVKIEKLKRGESAFSKDNLPSERLKRILTNTHHSWSNDKVFKKRESVEVCTCLGTSGTNEHYHTTISKNGQCVLCDHYTFHKNLSLNDDVESNITYYTEDEILEFKSKNTYHDPVKVINLLNKHKLDVEKVAQELRISDIKLDLMIQDWSKTSGVIFNGKSTKTYFKNIPMVEEILRVSKIHKKIKDRAEELGLLPKRYSQLVSRLRESFPFLKEL